MKKFFVLAALAAGMMFTSCSKSVEDQAKDYVKQLFEAEKAGDKEKIEKINAEAEEWSKSLSPEDQEKVKKAGEEALMEYAAEAMKDLQ